MLTHAVAFLVYIIMKLGHSCVRVMQSRLYDSRVRGHVIVHLALNLTVPPIIVGAWSKLRQ